MLFRRRALWEGTGMLQEDFGPDGKKNLGVTGVAQ